MAVDTRDRRMSMIGMDLVDPMMANPSGTIGQEARAMLLWLYSGISMYIVRKIIELTVRLYSRTLSVNLYGRLRIISLYARTFIAKLFGRTLKTKLPERDLEITMRTE